MPDRPVEREEDFLTWVIRAATLHHWLVFHPRPARTAKGWRTPTQGHNGYPDLTLARDGRVLHVELKTTTGRLSPDQQAWRDAIGDTWRCWRPSARGAILAELAGPTRVDVA